MDIVYRGRTRSETRGNVKIFFELIPASGINYDAGSLVNIQWFFDTDQQMPTKLCALANPSHGTIQNNTMVDVPMLSGTLYSVDWRAQVNGVRQDQVTTLCGFVAISGG
jgi:hypothetical protein